MLVALVTLTCSVGMRATQAPFIAPASYSLVTPTSAPLMALAPATETQAVVILPTETEGPPPTPEPTNTHLPPVMYTVQAGDILSVVAVRFGVSTDEIRELSPGPLPEDKALLTPGQILIIPARLSNTTSPQRLLPDSELVFGPSAVDFDIAAYVKEAGGYLSTYQEYMRTTANTSGAQIIKRVATENSINPRLLLALLEYQSGWVYGQPASLAQAEYPMGYIDLSKRGLYAQLIWAVKHLSVGYYGWREGLLTEVSFSDGVTARLDPSLNAGTVALQYYFAKLYDTQGWVQVFDLNNGFPALYDRMYTNAWARAATVEPLYPPGLVQPPLVLPFVLGQMWSYSGGPHGAWEHEGARAALDFAPASVESGCVKSDAWAVASAAGLVVRSDNAVVMLDLDGDGYEQTGWVLLYLHLATANRIRAGTQVEVGDPLGHPSCEGGQATGTHVHIARKYNGEWIPADGPIPFNLSGWIAHNGDQPYLGSLTKDGLTVYASIYGSFESRIRRYADYP